MCYSSFELIRQRLKSSKKKHKFEDMVHFMNLFETEDEEEEKSSSQSQLMGEPMVCNKVLDHIERGEGSQSNSSLSHSHSEFSSFHKEGLCWLDSVGRKNNISVEACKEGEVLNSEILNEIVDMSFEISHDSSFPRSVGY